MQTIKINDIEIFPGEGNIQINDIQGHDLLAIWDKLTTQYPGYELVLCFRNMQAPMDALSSIGATLLEDCIDFRVSPDEFVPHDGANISLLEKSEFEEFAKLHDTIANADFYWTSPLVWQEWDIWRICVYKKNGKITGYSMIMVEMRDNTIGEVFAVEADSPAVRMSLLSAAVKAAFEMGKSCVVNMVERDDTHGHEATLALGFREVGYYRGYIVRSI